jgi:cytochrome P450
MATQIQDNPSDTLADVDPSDRSRFLDGSIHPLMQRLREEAPIHYCNDSPYGPYWSITKHRDIIEIEAVPAIYSSETENGGIAILDAERSTLEGGFESFISMDPPRHSAKRRTVAPAFTPSEMQRLKDDIRARTIETLDNLPRGETFNWVDHVSVSLTRDMLAILFDYPWGERDNLIIWSDAITSFEMMENQPQERMGLLFQMATRFHQLWDERSNAEPTPDLLSMMIHSDALGDMDAKEFMGNMALMIVAGNDTTRNSMSSVIAAFNQFPEEWDKLLQDEVLIGNAATEVIRWQTPVAHMRRTVMEDTEFRGHQFKKGDKIVMWYISANRDETVFDQGDRFDISRDNARKHIAFGYGIHRCLGARLADLQIQVLLSEMRTRNLMPKLVGEIERTNSPFINGITNLPVRIEQQ